MGFKTFFSDKVLLISFEELVSSVSCHFLVFHWFMSLFWFAFVTHARACISSLFIFTIWQLNILQSIYKFSCQKTFGFCFFKKHHHFQLLPLGALDAIAWGEGCPCLTICKAASYHKGLGGPECDSSQGKNPDTDTNVLWDLQRQFKNPYMGLIRPDWVNFLTGIEFTGNRSPEPLFSLMLHRY